MSKASRAAGSQHRSRSRRSRGCDIQSVLKPRVFGGDCEADGETEVEVEARIAGIMPNYNWHIVVRRVRGRSA